MSQLEGWLVYIVDLVVVDKDEQWGKVCDKTGDDEDQDISEMIIYG
jgi:hypothetical protein